MRQCDTMRESVSCVTESLHKNGRLKVTIIGTYSLRYLMRTTMMPTPSTSQPAASSAAVPVAAIVVIALLPCFRCFVAFNQSQLTGNFHALADELTAIRRFALTLLQVYRAECHHFPLPWRCHNPVPTSSNCFAHTQTHRHTGLASL